MYIKQATVEDITEAIRILRAELYPYLDKELKPYNGAMIERFLRERFHIDRIVLALVSGETVGLIWTAKKVIPGRYKESLVPIALVMKDRHRNKDVALALIKNSEDFAHHKNMDRLELMNLRSHIDAPFYHG
ncbi:MAG: hypothetical protein QCI38_07890, partial [Candidatus Thermoplasmatota archaeon]|nr:hypothetical protein [Candidatus Thermoplasmatota archaeon]